MPGKTEISWATDTWNLAWGCDKVSPGCAHCYIEHTPPFRMRGMEFVKGKIPIVLHRDRMDVPIRWKRPRMIFVNSLSDFWHDDIPLEFIAEAYAVMFMCPQHIFQVLTKRPERMRDTLPHLDFWELVGHYVLERGGPSLLPMDDEMQHVILPNVWHGVTVENRAWADRADLLRVTPSAVRFISAEPLLGPLLPEYTVWGDPYPRDMQTGDPSDQSPQHHWHDSYDGAGLDLTGIDWIIVGGESGKKARPFKEQWARDIIYRAQHPEWHGSVFELRDPVPTAVHVKQMGTLWAHQHGVSGKAEQPSEWPEDLRLREWPAALGLPAETMPTGQRRQEPLF